MEADSSPVKFAALHIFDIFNWARQAGLGGSVYFELLFYYALYRDLYWQQFETGPAKVAVKTEDLLDIFLAHEGE